MIFSMKNTIITLNLQFDDVPNSNDLNNNINFITILNEIDIRVSYNIIFLRY